jgi:hypothetical protein
LKYLGLSGLVSPAGFAADEADGAVVGVEDREDDPVAEAVDELAAV